MLCDALATVFAALVGTTTSGAFIESAAGVQAGGRTGLTAVFIAALFTLSLFFAPLVSAIPAAAYGPALVIIGSMMMAPIAKIDFDDPTESIPAFTVIALISFAYNIGVGSPLGWCSIRSSSCWGAAPLRSPWHYVRSRLCRPCSSPFTHTPREPGFRSSLGSVSGAQQIEAGRHAFRMSLRSPGLTPGSHPDVGRSQLWWKLTAPGTRHRGAVRTRTFELAQREPAAASEPGRRAIRSSTAISLRVC